MSGHCRAMFGAIGVTNGLAVAWFDAGQSMVGCLGYGATMCGVMIWIGVIR